MPDRHAVAQIRSESEICATDVAQTAKRKIPPTKLEVFSIKKELSRRARELFSNVRELFWIANGLFSSK